MANSDYFSQFEEAKPESGVSQEDYYSQFPPDDQETPGIKGVAKDLQQKLFQTAMGVVPALAKAPSEIYGGLEQVLKIPYETAQMAMGKQGLPRATQGVVGGFGDIGHAILSTPGAFRDYLVKKQLAPESSPSFRLPESVLPKEFDYSKALGREGEQRGDIAMNLLPGLVGASNVAEAASQVVPLTKGIAASPLKKARKIAKQREVTGLQISKPLMKDVEKLLPSGSEYKDLLKAAKKGDYDALFTLQSDLGAHAREYSKFPSTGAERLRGQLINKKRQELINTMKKELIGAGHEDIAKLMSKGQDRYRRFSKQRPYRRAVYGAGAGAALSQSPEARHLLRNLLLKE